MDSSLDDAALWQAFGASALPAAAWTHRAHLRVAWLFLKRHPLDEAHLLMRAGIIRLNAFHGLVETPARGYHETLTRLWLLLIAARMQAADSPSSDAFVDAHAAVLGKDAVARHYSRERLAGARDLRPARSGAAARRRALTRRRAAPPGRPVVTTGEPRTDRAAAARSRGGR